MNVKKFFIASLAVFIAFQIMDMIIHGAILGPTYQLLSNLWRPDMMDKMWIMHLTSAILSFLFVYIFARGYEGKGLCEGLRYGFLIGILMNVVGAFNQHAIYPVPLSLSIQWFIYGVIEFMVCGMVASLIYKTE